jgi:hypothetical protein
VSTSITSGLGDYYRKAYEGHRQQNPYVRYFNDRPGGYVRIDLTPQERTTRGEASLRITSIHLVADKGSSRKPPNSFATEEEEVHFAYCS